MKATRQIQTISNSLVPAARNASANGTGIDLANYNSNMFVANFGAITDGTHTPKLQDSPDNSTWTDVAAANLSGAFAAGVASTPQQVSYIGGQRYVRVVMTVAGATTGALSAAFAVLSGKRKQP